MFLLISWMKMTLSMVWVKPIVESTREDIVISVIAQMIRYIQRTSVLCTEHTTLSSLVERLHLDCFLTIRRN